MSSSSTPPDHDNAPRSSFGWRTVLVIAIVAAIVGGAYLVLRGTPQSGFSSRPKAAEVFTQPDSNASKQPLTLQWHVVTAGPSPFNANVWTARLELSATGGDGHYIFWVNNQRLPDASPNQFTIDSSACDVVGQVVGVTSAGQAAAQALVVHSPLPNCPTP